MGHIIFIKLLLSYWDSSQTHPLSALLLSYAFQNKLSGTSIFLYLVTFFFSLHIDCKLFQFMYSRFLKKKTSLQFLSCVNFLFSYNAAEMVSGGGVWGVFMYYFLYFLLCFYFLNLSTCYFCEQAVKTLPQIREWNVT